MMEPRDNSSCMTGDGRVIQLHLQRGSKHSKSFKDTQRTQRRSKGLKGPQRRGEVQRGQMAPPGPILRFSLEMLQKYNTF